ncbi:MAG: hypothetical protein A2Y60_02930 [Chloroflexi bacterium RBG_13_54_9]|nr:MAG: hypothetical protein A2Y60_02930 [Chloroflexi bacterium RBG_13_54_9]
MPKKWKYLVTAPNQITAEMWRDLLIEEGIPAMIAPQDAVSFMGVSALPCRIMVPEEKLDEATKILEAQRQE